MNGLINIVASSRFLKGDIGDHLVRASMVINPSACRKSLQVSEMLVRTTEWR